ncbi:MAG: ribose 5-phosphate isomerase B [Candidatus Cloacimonetes bacterium]|nr:ribose 5-phosphate isomerase B [Candidatus Cloacimonadota bacterium]MBT6994049.1 ribose 5-phosphate isomerase B [Candidatus Cloacimonadota bacterium]MBT7468853.1 ribose 5-phosphate isomerase B [Candidatus Cloacimonadota bacterium]
MKIAIASDHAGFELKEAIKPFLSNFEIVDFGAHSNDSMNYPDTGFAAAEAVSSGECERGILICGSGIGMSIVANKVPKIRAALCQTKEFAELSRLHNDANILVLSGRFISKYLAKEIIDVWLSTKFEGNRHQKRIDIISQKEKK